MIRQDGGKTCEFGAGAVAAWCLAALEVDGIEAGRNAIEFFDATLPGTRPMVRPEQLLVEWTRPFIGPKEARARHDRVERSRPAHELFRLRAEIPLAVAEARWDLVRELAADARDLVEPLCAPLLASLADWGEAAVLAGRGKTQESLELVLASLETVPEPYLAARLAVDLVGLLPEAAGRSLRTDVATRLEAMHATSSLAQLRAT